MLFIKVLLFLLDLKGVIAPAASGVLSCNAGIMQNREHIYVSLSAIRAQGAGLASEGV